MDFSDVCGVTGIYSIKIQDYIYIGQSKDMYIRWSKHISMLRHNKHDNNFLQNVYNKYGESALSFSIIDATSISDLTPSEQWYLDTLKMFYPNDKILNLAPVAGSQLGLKRSDETKAKMSAWQVGRKLSLETRANMSASKLGRNVGTRRSAETRAKIGAAMLGKNAGKKHSDEHRAKIRAASLGRKHSAESRAKVSAAKLGVKHSAEHRAKVSAAQAKTYNIILLAPNGERHGPITNLKAFSIEHGLDWSHMYKVITGKANTHKGWRLD